MNKIILYFLCIIFTAENTINSMNEDQLSLFDNGIDLIKAVRQNDLQRVKELIVVSPNINIQDEYQRTALMWAAFRDRLDITKELIAAGAYLNMHNKEKESALIGALSRNCLETAHELIKAGAYINIRDKYQKTTLMWAAFRGHLSIIKELIRAGAHLDMQDSSGATALMWASSRGHLDIVKELVVAGADSTLYNNDANGLSTALALAVDNNHTDIAHFLNIFHALDEDFTQIALQDLPNELAEMFIYRLLYQQKYAALIKFLEYSSQTFATISEDTQKIIEFIKKWHKHTLNPMAARAILLNQEDNCKDTVEKQVYDYAKKHTLKPLGCLIRSWARTAHELSKFSELMTTQYHHQDQASFIGSFSTLDLNDHASWEEVIAIGKAIKNDDILLIRNLVRHKTYDFNEKESTYLREILERRPWIRLSLNWYDPELINLLALTPTVLGIVMTIGGKECTEMSKMSVEDNANLPAYYSCALIRHAPLAIALPLSALYLGNYAFSKYSEYQIKKHKIIHKILVSREG